MNSQTIYYKTFPLFRGSASEKWKDLGKRKRARERSRKEEKGKERVLEVDFFVEGYYSEDVSECLFCCSGNSFAAYGVF